MKTKKLFLATILLGFLLMFSNVSAQFNGGFSSTNFWKLIGNWLLPINNSWKVGTTTTTYYGNGSNLSGIGTTTTINGVSASSFTFATSTSGGLSLVISTSTGQLLFTNSVASGYVMPTSTSFNNWNTAYSWGNHAGLYDILGQATSTLGTHTTAYNHALFLTTETDPFRAWNYSGLNVFLTTSTSNVGIGTSSPSSLLSIYSATAPIFSITSATSVDTVDPAIYFRTGTTPFTRQMIYLDDNNSDKLIFASSTGNYPALSISTDGTLVSQIPVNSTTALQINQFDTPYLTIDTTANLEKIVVGKNLETGTMEIDADSGMVNFANMNISTTTATSTAESLSISIDGNAIITAYAEADGMGNAINKRVGINTTTTPTAVLSIKGNASTSGAMLKISTSTLDVFYIDSGGKTGIGTSSPTSLLHIANQTATSTITIGEIGSGKGACLKLKDYSGTGWTYCSVLTGTMTCSTNSCE